MEYLQQVLVHVAADKMGDARVLFDDLEAHRRELRGLRGFMAMSVSRSIEAGGDTLVSVETRWKDEASLNQYLTSSRTAESIARSHAAITVPDSLNVRRLEAVDSAAEPESRVVYERFASALLVPAGIFVFGLALIYSLSRVYLEMGSEGATPLAIIIAAGILLIAWYFAENPRVPQWQMAGVAGLAVAALVGGTITAQVMEGPAIHRDEPHVESPTPGNETPPAPGETVIEMQDNVFVVNGAENPTITAAAGAETRFALSNAGKALHNIHVEVNGYDAAFCRLGGEDPCSDPPRINGGADGELVFTLPSGSYEYRCDFHTAEMVGTLEVQ